MLNYHRICLLSTGCFMSNSVQRPFYSKHCQSNIVSIVHTYPPKTHSFDSFLKFSINPQSLTNHMMDQTHPYLKTTVMLPQILTKVATKSFYTFNSTFYSQNDNFSLRAESITCKCNLITCLCCLKNSNLFKFCHLYLREERFSKSAFIKQFRKIICKLRVLN